MAQNAAASNVSMLNMLAGLPKTLFGSKASSLTTGGSTTEQTVFSQEAINSILRGIMEGTSGGSGLAAITGGQKAPGLYNSTTRNLLTNDFIARAAAQTAEKNAPRITTREPTRRVETTPGVMGKGTAALLTAAAIGSSKKGRAAVGEGYDKLTQILSGKDALGNASTVGDWVGSEMYDFADVGTSILSGTGSASSALELGDDLLGSGLFNSGGADVASSGVSSLASMFPETDLESFASLVEGGDSISFLPDMGGFSTAGLGDLMRGDFADAATTAVIANFVPGGQFLTAADSIFGTDITGQIGDKIFDDILGITDGKVICTELCRQGLLSKHLYIAEATANLKRLSPVTLAGYHWIAMPVVRKMRMSKRLSNFLLPWVVDYSNEVLYQTGGIRGKFVRFILEPVCYLTGLVVGKQDYKQLYSGV